MGNDNIITFDGINVSSTENDPRLHTSKKLIQTADGQKRAYALHETIAIKINKTWLEKRPPRHRKKGTTSAVRPRLREQGEKAKPKATLDPAVSEQPLIIEDLQHE
ncbi:Hypothetical_protein [Hexamita inflata]|uniref:Hypothetical_protein n=1 Tax=Hexamita inflata TaxID=28002 RepID=A0AA86Q625_9EUKA|nr:Hypothetical protein HINF_LOCUS40729 [Hexamita inflata]